MTQFLGMNRFKYHPIENKFTILFLSLFHLLQLNA